MSLPVVIDTQSATWVNLRIDLTEKLGKAYGRLKDAQKDFAETQVIRGEIAAYEYVLGLEAKLIKNNQRAFDTPAHN